MFLLHNDHDLVDDLVGNIVDMRASLDCANGVDKADLLELAITQRADDFPPVRTSLFH